MNQQPIAISTGGTMRADGRVRDVTYCEAKLRDSPVCRPARQDREVFLPPGGTTPRPAFVRREQEGRKLKILKPIDKAI
jgi:hypothetical protein